MSRYFICLGLLAFTTLMLTGCASRPTRTSMTWSPDTYLIFNPQWTGIAIADTPRGPWPTTTTFQTFGEDIEYRETTIDIQGRHGFNSDRTYRRFESTRRGHRSR